MSPHHGFSSIAMQPQLRMCLLRAPNAQLCQPVLAGQHLPGQQPAVAAPRHGHHAAPQHGAAEAPLAVDAADGARPWMSLTRC